MARLRTRPRALGDIYPELPIATMGDSSASRPLSTVIIQGAYMNMLPRAPRADQLDALSPVGTSTQSAPRRCT